MIEKSGCYFLILDIQLTILKVEDSLKKLSILYSCGKLPVKRKLGIYFLTQISYRVFFYYFHCAKS